MTFNFYEYLHTLGALKWKKWPKTDFLPLQTGFLVCLGRGGLFLKFLPEIVL